GDSYNYEIDDQGGAQLNASTGVLFNQFGNPTDTPLWDRGNAGSCGNPYAVKINPIVDNGGLHFTVTAKKVRRPGWNQHGVNFLDAPSLPSVSSWCGSLNITPCGGGSTAMMQYITECRPPDPTCRPEAVWRVTLDTGTTIEVADAYTANPLALN